MMAKKLNMQKRTQMVPLPVVESQFMQAAINTAYVNSIYWRAVLPVFGHANSIATAALASGGTETIATVARCKAALLEALDTLRTTLSEIEKVMGETQELNLRYLHDLYDLATDYVEATSDMQPRAKRALRAYVEAQDPTGWVSEVITAIDRPKREQLQPGIVAILRYHAAHFKHDEKHKTYPATERQFKMFARRNSSPGTQEAVNILTHNELKSGEQWGRIIRRYEGIKLDD